MSDTKPARKAPRKRVSKSKATTAATAPEELAHVLVTSGEPPCLIRFPIDVRWRDLDAFNHVNNANFLTYVEEARLAWMQSLPGPWVTERSAPVLAAANVNFRRPIAWPESLIIELSAQRVGTSSLTLAYRMVSAGDSTALYADGETVMVWVDAESGKAASLPEAVRAGTLHDS
ncbi:MAG: acyl-CoA thioesterase [Xanthomonadales bacterium]|nr:acyl-CoA thioesterase [Xanthomonadales bacterium]